MEYESQGDVDIGIEFVKPEPIIELEEKQHNIATREEIEEELHRLRALTITQQLAKEPEPEPEPEPENPPITKDEFIQLLLAEREKMKQALGQQQVDEEEIEENSSIMSNLRDKLWKFKNRKKIKEYEERQRNRKLFDPNRMPK